MYTAQPHGVDVGHSDVVLTSVAVVSGERCGFDWSGLEAIITHILIQLERDCAPL